MRPPFTDGWNSFWHFTFGMVAVQLPWTAILFLLYQFVLKYDANSPIDTFEYGMGAVTYLVLCSLSPFVKRVKI